MTVDTIAPLKFVDMRPLTDTTAPFPAVFAKFNGTLLVADESPQVLEGEWQCDKVVVMSFPNTEEAERFRQSKEYLEIVKDRKAGAEAIVLFVTGLPAWIRTGSGASHRDVVKDGRV